MLWRQAVGALQRLRARSTPGQVGPRTCLVGETVRRCGRSELFPVSENSVQAKPSGPRCGAGCRPRPRRENAPSIRVITGPHVRGRAAQQPAIAAVFASPAGRIAARWLSADQDHAPRRRRWTAVRTHSGERRRRIVPWLKRRRRLSAHPRVWSPEHGRQWNGRTRSASFRSTQPANIPG